MQLRSDIDEPLPSCEMWQRDEEAGAGGEVSKVTNKRIKKKFSSCEQVRLSGDSGTFLTPVAIVTARSQAHTTEMQERWRSVNTAKFLGIQRRFIKAIHCLLGCNPVQYSEKKKSNGAREWRFKSEFRLLNKPEVTTAWRCTPCPQYSDLLSHHVL